MRRRGDLVGAGAMLVHDVRIFDGVDAPAQAALNRLSTVRSRRCALVLRRLEADLAALPPTHRPAPIRSLHDQLRAI